MKCGKVIIFIQKDKNGKRLTVSDVFCSLFRLFKYSHFLMSNFCWKCKPSVSVGIQNINVSAHEKNVGLLFMWGFNFCADP